MSRQTDKIMMAHGSGGRFSQELFQNVFQPKFSNPFLNEVHDGAILDIEGKRLAFTTDSYVVSPLFFPGGNIGDLAINGTVNDLAMCGAKPLYLSAGFILEEGFEIEKLQQITQSMSTASEKAGVLLVTGDTKVVENGNADGVYINTAGIGLVDQNRDISPKGAKEGDLIIINGRIADHGIAILSKREGLDFESDIKSDSAPLNGLVEVMLKTSSDIHVLRDPTRGGIAATLNEIAEASKLGILIEEQKIPISESVISISSLLGIDPFNVANEGKLLAIVGNKDAEAVLDVMRSHPFGADSSIIGEIVSNHPGKVVLKTAIGTKRLVDMPSGENLPRIC